MLWLETGEEVYICLLHEGKHQLPSLGESGHFEMGYSKVDLIFIEGDSKVVVEALSKLEPEILWRILNICSGMSLLLSQFTNVSVNWVPRNSNGASHTMVKWSVKHNLFCSSDIGCCPPCFESIIRVEASSPASL